MLDRAGDLRRRAHQDRQARRQYGRHTLDEEGPPGSTSEAELEELKQKGVTPKYIYTIPTVQNPTGAIMGEARRAELLKIARDYGVIDLRGRVAIRPRVERQAPAVTLCHGGRRRRDPYRLVLPSIAPALRVGYIVASGDPGPHPGLKTDAGSGALEQMVLAEFWAAFRRSCRKLSKTLAGSCRP